MRGKTIFLDIDGCILEHVGTVTNVTSLPPKVLPGVLKRFNEWDSKGYRIILTTGRRESLRKVTEEQLSSFGLFYDCLIMGIGGGPRILINDLKPGSTEPTAIAFNLVRNEGMEGVEI